MAPYDVGFEPKDLIPNAIFSPEKGHLSEEEKEKLGHPIIHLRNGHEQLCRACGWSTHHEIGSSYLPRLRIYHSRENAGLWFMGNDYVIWDRPGNTGIQTNDYMTYKFLRERGTKDIPLVEEMHQYGKEGDPFLFIVMSRVKGRRLEDIWGGLTPEEKRSYADQMIAALRELRQFTASSPQRVDGSPLWDNVIGLCGPPIMCKTIPKTKEEWLDNMDEELRVGIAKLENIHDPAAIEARIQQLRTNFPENDDPFVLTHADLNMGNIIVHDGKILAIIDWELAGYYPWWVERWASYQRALSENADELFDMVWAEVNPELTRKEFVLKAARGANKTAFIYHRSDIEHKHSHDVWLRPRWCECKPFGGVVRGHHWGGFGADAGLEHYTELGQKRKTWTRGLTEGY